MARIRSIKPEFPEDEGLGLVSRDARFLYVLLWTRCDDLGRFRASPALLAGQLYPYDDDVTARALTGWMEELVAIERVRLYEVKGQQYAEVVNWGKHQRIDNASKQNLMPTPPWANPEGSPPPSAGRRDSPRPSACGEPFAAGEEGSGGDQEGSGGDQESAAALLADAALELLAERIASSKPRDKASRYKAGTLKGLRAERGHTALAIARDHPSMTPAELVEELEPSKRLRAVPTCSNPDCRDGWDHEQDPPVPCLECGKQVQAS